MPYQPKHTNTHIQRGRVIAVNGLKQADAQAFAFRTASAVVGLFGAQVALNFGVAEVAKAHSHSGQIDLCKPAGLANDGDGGLKNHGLPAHVLQLGYGAVMGAGLTQGDAVQIGDLV